MFWVMARTAIIANNPKTLERKKGFRTSKGALIGFASEQFRRGLINRVNYDDGNGRFFGKSLEETAAAFERLNI